MKRFFFSLIALTAVAAGCTQSAMLEAPDLFNKEISFSPYTGRTPETKAAAIVEASGLANAGGFYVYCYLNKNDGSSTSTSLYMDNEHVTSTDNGENWGYGHRVYWPEASNSTLSFVAYSANAWGSDYEEDADNATQMNDLIEWTEGKEGEEFTFTVPNSMGDQVDLLATAMQENLSLSSSDKVSTAGAVSLHFHHLLSRVGFKIETTTDKAITITGLSLQGKMPTQGTLNLTDGAKGEEIPSLISGTGVSKEYSYITDPVRITGASESAKAIYPSASNPGVNTEHLMIIPHDVLASAEGSGSDHSIVVSYKVGESTNENHASVQLQTGFQFAAGRSYEFILQVSTSSLSFEVEEQEWNTDLNDNNKNDDDINIGPLEPEDDSDDESGEDSVIDEIATSHTLNTQTAQRKEINMTYTLNSVENNLAVISIDVLTEYNDGGTFLGVGYNSLVGIAYATIDSKDWTNFEYYESESVSVGQYTVIIRELLPSTEYKYCLRVARKGTVSGSISRENTFDDTILTFTTPSEFVPLQMTSSVPEVTVSKVNGVQQGTAVFTHGAISPNVDGVAIPVSEYGFCWMTGNGNPTKLNRWVNQASGSSAFIGSLTEGYSYTLGNLRPNFTYTYCSYAIISADVYAYVIPQGEISAVRTLVYEANTVLFSAPVSFMINPIVNDGDDTGSGWEGDTEIDINSGSI